MISSVESKRPSLVPCKITIKGKAFSQANQGKKKKEEIKLRKKCHKLLYIEAEELLPSSSCEASIPLIPSLDRYKKTKLQINIS